MANHQTLAFIGYASGLAANNVDCALGPWYLYYHPELLHPLTADWQAMVQANGLATGQAAWPAIQHSLQALGQAVLPLAQRRQAFCVIGGDHSSAMGTWSAVAHANRPRGDIGLIWIDAHMDSHTPETSKTQNIHGMPVAHLLGRGLPALCQLFDAEPKLKPENICLIGVRSYEAEEAALLARLGIRVYYMPEIHARGLAVVVQEAIDQVKQHTCGFGVSLDLDAVDPTEAPGVGCPAPHGLRGQALTQALQGLAQDPAFLGVELVEFNPMRDHRAQTAQLLVALLHSLYREQEHR